jgi:peptidoglycan hydrolase-like protein with peptidoglycan-binding domain
MTNAEIRNVQAALNALPSSLPRLSVDGVAGQKTFARVAEWQAANNYLPTGYLTSDVAQAILNSASGGLYGRLATTPAPSSKKVVNLVTSTAQGAINAGSNASSGDNSNLFSTNDQQPQQPQSGFSMTTVLIIAVFAFVAFKD